MEIRQHPGELDFADKRVTVVGLGIEGVDLARYLSRHGAFVTVSDSKSRARLAERVGEVDELGVRLALGSNKPRDIAEAEALFVSQGVPLDLPGVERARARGVPMYSMMGLFMELCAGPIAGITGSSGKTTTTALVGEMFEADERPVFVGGNIGIGLLDHLSSVRAVHVVGAGGQPHATTARGAQPARGGDLEHHAEPPRPVLVGRLPAAQGRHYPLPDARHDIAVLGYDDAECRALAPEVKGRLLWFSLSAEIPGDGVSVRDGWAIIRHGRLEERCSAWTRSGCAGATTRRTPSRRRRSRWPAAISPEAIACAVETFRGVPHRLEFVAEVEGVSYYNDSIATTPERALAGIRSFEEPVVLLLGGRDKQLPLEELAREATATLPCRGALRRIGRQAGGSDAGPPDGPRRSTRVEGLAEAVEAAHALAEAGDVVLLSPACTSYDAYENFERSRRAFPLACETDGEAYPEYGRRGGAAIAAVDFQGEDRRAGVLRPGSARLHAARGDGDAGDHRPAGCLYVQLRRRLSRVRRHQLLRRAAGSVRVARCHRNGRVHAAGLQPAAGVERANVAAGAGGAGRRAGAGTRRRA